MRGAASASMASISERIEGECSPLRRAPRQSVRCARAVRRCRSASKHSTEPAMATLSDSERPAIGMVICWSTRARTSAGRPWASLPEHHGHRAPQIGLVVRQRRHPPPWPRAARPRLPARSSTSTRRRRWRRARGRARPPRRARTSGCWGRPSSRRRPPRRRRRPRRRAGGCPRCQDRPRRRAPARAVRWRPPRRRPERSPRRGAAIAASPFGVTVSTARASTSGVTSRQHRAGLDGQRHHGRRPHRRVAKTSSTGTPAASASPQQDGAVDDERPLLQTRTAAPREAPQPLHARHAGSRRAPGCRLRRSPRPRPRWRPAPAR